MPFGASANQNRSCGGDRFAGPAYLCDVSTLTVALAVRPLQRRRSLVKVVIVYKWARNPADAVVRADGSLDWRNARMAVGEDDPAALAVARQLVESSGDELIGLTIGDGDASWALARGVEQAFSVTDAPSLTDNAATAAIIAAGVRRIGDVDVVVIGDAEQEPGVAAAVAGALGWPGMVGLRTATVQDGRLLAVRRVGQEQQTIALPVPAVLGVAAEADVDRPPGMKELLAARKRPMTRLTLAELGVETDDVASVGFHKPAMAPARVFDGAPTEAAAQLVAALRAEGVL